MRARLREGGRATLRMRGRSMSPLLPPGAVVALRALRPGERLRGSIVALDAGAIVVVHRVIWCDGDLVQTQGLRTPSADAHAPRRAIIGVVCGVKGLLGGERALVTVAALVATAARTWRTVRRRW